MNILNLPDWDVQSVSVTDLDITVTATYKPQPTACLRCGSMGEKLKSSFVKFGTTCQTIHDLPTLGKRMTIEAIRPRYRCRDCKATFSQPLPDVDERGTMTKRLVKWMRNQSLSHTFAEVAAASGVTEGTVRNVFRDYLEYLDKNITFLTPAVLGIDELTLLKKPRCILVNVGERCVIDLLESRQKAVVERNLLLMSNRDKVTHVCMDMWPAYRDAAKAAFPNAVVVVDKYHVVRLASAALERVRKELRAGLSDKRRRALMHDRFILLKRKSRLKEQEMLTLDVWINKFPILGTAYALKEQLCELFDSDVDGTKARAQYAAWKESIPAELVTHFRELTTALTNWETEIFAYFDHRVTNAYTEAVNGLAKTLNRNGRGYSFDVIRAKALYTKATHKKPNVIREPGMHYYYPEIERLLVVEATADGSHGADISTLTEILSEGEETDTTTTDYG